MIVNETLLRIEVHDAGESRPGCNPRQTMTCPGVASSSLTLLRRRSDQELEDTYRLG
ncbi:hypothetical protein [Streptomyces sp. Isolate_219]|uniref:hypothetical protein n=1 Tax=Streptomyces sp. Isolate_219 TaxID=2950110 RepID=UPI0021C9A02E|nr:hypothetical protein [Streptomyces sp. Isolate_219]MCR8577016.1 hypothetical protein [Streptomyces sp. Isolate_219]